MGMLTPHPAWYHSFVKRETHMVWGRRWDEEWVAPLPLCAPSLPLTPQPRPFPFPFLHGLVRHYLDIDDEEEEALLLLTASTNLVRRRLNADDKGKEALLLVGSRHYLWPPQPHSVLPRCQRWGRGGVTAGQHHLQQWQHGSKSTRLVKAWRCYLSSTGS